MFPDMKKDCSIPASARINLAGAYEIITRTIPHPGIGAIQILRNNPKRWGFIIDPGTLASFAISPSPAVTVNNGIIMTGVKPIFQCNVRDHASLPQVEWFAAALGALDIFVIEIVIA